MTGYEDGQIVYICGHKWRTVDTRYTYAGVAYKYKDVVRAGGLEPWWTTNNVYDEPKDKE